jgi:hypothetical protein
VFAQADGRTATVGIPLRPKCRAKPKDGATHSIAVVSAVVFLLPFSAQKSHVKGKIPQLEQNKANKNEI